MKRRILWILTPAVAALAIAGTAMAAGAQPHHGGTGGRFGARYAFGFGRGGAPLGSVQSLSGSTLTVLEFDGQTETYTVGDNTQYFLNGRSAMEDAVVAGLNVVVAVPHGWGSSSGSSTTAAAVFLFSPGVLGNIQSVTTGTSGDTINVLNPQGFAFTIQTSSTTTFFVNGTSSNTAPTFTDGEIIAALGVVDSTNKDQLDATQVNVVPHGSHW